jgi:hypothetical protein
MDRNYTSSEFWTLDREAFRQKLSIRSRKGCQEVRQTLHPTKIDGPVQNLYSLLLPIWKKVFIFQLQELWTRDLWEVLCTLGRPHGSEDLFEQSRVAYSPSVRILQLVEHRLFHGFVAR